MIELETMDQYNNVCEKAKDLVVLYMYGISFAPDRLLPLVEEMEEKYSGSISFYKVCAQRNIQIFSKYFVSSVPSVLMMSKGKYGGTEMHVHATLHEQDITKENLMTLISEYRNDVPLK